MLERDAHHHRNVTKQRIKHGAGFAAGQKKLARHTVRRIEANGCIESLAVDLDRPRLAWAAIRQAMTTGRRGGHSVLPGSKSRRATWTALSNRLAALWFC